MIGRRRGGRTGTWGRVVDGDIALWWYFAIAPRTFQYFAIASMSGLGVTDGLRAAAKADVMSLTAFEIGLFDLTVIMTFVLVSSPHHVNPGMPVYWFLTRVEVTIGFVTAWPANAWLERRGIKVPM